MPKLTKSFLILSLLGFIAGGAIDAISSPIDPKWTVVLPLGAVFFGLFLIFLMLQKEMAAFDQEEAAKLQLVKQSTPSGLPATAPGNHPSLHHPQPKSL